MDQNLKDWVLQHPKDMQENALKEAIQNYVLDGLSQTDFFSQAAFYGGTALRLFYQLPRFSEDLDFTLKYRKRPSRAALLFSPPTCGEMKSGIFCYSIQTKSRL